MKRCGKVLITFVALVMVGGMLLGNYEQVVGNDANPSISEPVKVGLFSKDLTDDYIASICELLKGIQKDNEGKVEFSFYDSKGNQRIQNESINRALKEGINLIYLDIADTTATQEVINMIKQENAPVIMFNREPLTMEAIKSYSKAVYIGTDSKQAGTLQGQMIVDEWNKNKQLLDKGGNKILHYIMLMGEKNNLVPIERTKYCLLTIQQAGIKVEELESRNCDWSTEIAKNTTEAMFLKYGAKIDIIISNDDSMAIGAVQGLQTYGYNEGDKIKTIAVVGIDGVPEARKLISEGFMLGTVAYDNRDTANALYTVGMNLVYNRNPLEGTEYKFDDTGVAIRLPYEGYIESK